MLLVCYKVFVIFPTTCHKTLLVAYCKTLNVCFVIYYVLSSKWMLFWIANSNIATVLCQDNGSCTTECVSGDWFGEVREVDLKQEPLDVCCLFAAYSVCHDRKILFPINCHVSVFWSHISREQLNSQFHGRDIFHEIGLLLW